MVIMVDVQEKQEGNPPVQRKPRTINPPTPATSSPWPHATPRISIEDGFKRKFKSYRLRGDYEKPWLADPAMNKTWWNNLIVSVFMGLGLFGAAIICFFMVLPYQNLPVSLLSTCQCGKRRKRVLKC